MPTKEQAMRMLYTLVRVFLGGALTVVIGSGIGVFEMTIGDWKAAASAGIAAVIILVFNYVNPKDARYGVGSGAE